MSVAAVHVRWAVEVDVATAVNVPPAGHVGASPSVTEMPIWVPEMLPSLAVTDCVPAVTSVIALAKTWIPESEGVNE